MAGRVLIFGSSGNSGRNLTRYFLELGWHVLGVSRSQHSHEDPKFAHISGDITDASLYSKLLGEFDLVVNFAGIQPSILKYDENLERRRALQEYVSTNILGTSRVLDFVSARGIPTYVYATSHRDIESHWAQGRRLANNLPVSINPRGDHALYAATKASGMMLGDCVGESFGFRVFNLRLPMIFLVPQDPHYLKAGKQKLMPFLRLIRDARQGKALEVWGDPGLKRDYVHVKNLLNMVKLCFDSPLDGGTFAVGTGEAVSTESFVRGIAQEFAPGDKEISLVYRMDLRTYKNAIYEVEEQAELLGYSPVLLPEMLSLLHEELRSSDSFNRWGW
jgi:UDP-glucose 4-epimerase